MCMCMQTTLTTQSTGRTVTTTISIGDVPRVPSARHTHHHSSVWFSQFHIFVNILARVVESTVHTSLSTITPMCSLALWSGAIVAFDYQQRVWEPHRPPIVIGLWSCQACQEGRLNKKQNPKRRRPTGQRWFLDMHTIGQHTQIEDDSGKPSWLAEVPLPCAMRGLSLYIVGETSAGIVFSQMLFSVPLIAADREYPLL